MTRPTTHATAIKALKARAAVEQRKGNTTVAKNIRNAVKAVDNKDAKVRAQAKSAMRERGLWR